MSSVVSVGARMWPQSAPAVDSRIFFRSPRDIDAAAAACAAAAGASEPSCDGGGAAAAGARGASETAPDALEMRNTEPVADEPAADEPADGSASKADGAFVFLGIARGRHATKLVCGGTGKGEKCYVLEPVMIKIKNES